MSLKYIKIILMAIAGLLLYIPTMSAARSESGCGELGEVSSLESGPRSEKEIVKETITVTKVYGDSTVVSRTFTDLETARRWAAHTEAAFKPAKPVGRTTLSPFMMGAELGTGLDLSGTDLSTFNVDFLFGYRAKKVQFLGLSAGIHKSLGTKDAFLPLQLLFRTGFMSRPTLGFMQVSAGYSFNTVSSSPMFGDIIAMIGGGVNLVQRPKFQSNITLSFGFRHFSQRHQQMTNIYKQNVGFVQIAMGVSM